MMIYILASLALIGGLVWIYFWREVRVPGETDVWIEDILQKGVPELMPGEQDTVENGEVSICYEVLKAAGPVKGTICMINGHGQTLISFPPHFYQPLLDAGYQLIRMDNRGLGCSSWINEWKEEEAYSLEDMAQDVLAVLAKLAIEQVHLVGFSMGGMIAQQLAISHPNHVLSLNLLMTTGFYYDPEMGGIPKKFYRDFVLISLVYRRRLDQLKNQLRLSLAINRLLRGSSTDAIDDKWFLQRAYYEITKRKGYNPNVVDQHSAAIRLGGSRYEELKKLTLPTLIIHGKEDPLMPFVHAQQLARLMPHAETLFIDYLGHHLPRAQSEIISRSLVQLLTQIDASSS